MLCYVKFGHVSMCTAPNARDATIPRIPCSARAAAHAGAGGHAVPWGGGWGVGLGS